MSTSSYQTFENKHIRTADLACSTKYNINYHTNRFLHTTIQVQTSVSICSFLYTKFIHHFFLNKRIQVIKKIKIQHPCSTMKWWNNPRTDQKHRSHQVNWHRKTSHKTQVPSPNSGLPQRIMEKSIWSCLNLGNTWAPRKSASRSEVGDGNFQ